MTHISNLKHFKTSMSLEEQPSGSLLKAELRNHVAKIFTLQEERVHVWSEFDIKFKEYCLTAPQFDLKKLQLICKQISDKMNSISTRVIEIKNMFSSDVFDAKQVYALVDRLQLNEQFKFQTVYFAS